MRDIKFRIWNGWKMEYNVMAGFLGAFYVEGVDKKDSASMSQANTIYPKETPVMQYTGCVDKNGKEIYEKDILSVAVIGKFIEWFVVVTWSDYHNGWMTVHDESGNGKLYPFNNFDLIEVVGNSYENPDLLSSSTK